MPVDAHSRHDNDSREIGRSVKLRTLLRLLRAANSESVSGLSRAGNSIFSASAYHRLLTQAGSLSALCTTTKYHTPAPRTFFRGTARSGLRRNSRLPKPNPFRGFPSPSIYRTMGTALLSGTAIPANTSTEPSSYSIYSRIFAVTKNIFRSKTGIRFKWSV